MEMGALPVLLCAAVPTASAAETYLSTGKRGAPGIEDGQF